MDLLAPSTILGLSIGRIGCIMSGCCFGKVTSFFWGVKYRIVDNVKPQVLYFHPERANVAIHPTQHLSSLGAFLIFLVLIIYAKKRKFKGEIAILAFLLYAPVRFFIEFLRDDERGLFLGGVLSTSQIIAIITFVAALILYIYAKRRTKNV